MAMAENQGQHREQLESRVVNGNVANQTRGSYFAFILALVSIVGGFFLILKGKDASGLAAIITSLVALASVFFYAKYEQKKERMEKSTALQTRRRREP